MKQPIRLLAAVLLCGTALTNSVAANGLSDRIGSDSNRISDELKNSQATSYTAKIAGYTLQLTSTTPFSAWFSDGKEGVSTYGGTVNGVPVRVVRTEVGNTTSYQIIFNGQEIYNHPDGFAPGSRYSFTASGHNFTLVSDSSASLDNLRTNSPVSFLIDGTPIYSGALNNITDTAVYQALQSSGILPPQVDGTERVVQSASRSTTSVLTRRVASLIQPTNFMMNHRRNASSRSTAEGSATGLSAGDASRPDSGNGVAFWATGSYSRLSGDSALSDYSGHSSVYTAGADYTFDGSAVVGLSLVRDLSWLSLVGDRSLRTSGTGLVSYGGISMFDQSVSITALGGVFRTDSRSKALLTDSSYKGHRVMASLSGAYSYRGDSFSVGPTLGLLYAYNMDQSHITASGQRVDRMNSWVADVSAGIQGAYTLSTDFELSGGATYVRDLVPSLSSNSLVRLSDKDLVETTARLTWYKGDNFTAYVQASHNLFATDQKATSISASVRYSF